jgi:cytosine/adenosine deaminase-related metal-dependent hydrolase
MSRVLSADWVLPIDGPPIADGAVAIEDGRIAAVGTAAELGGGTHYGDAVIVPGFVNAHTHLEYATYAGFGDGEADFAVWIAQHAQRKFRLSFEEQLDIAKLGAAECLASGVTTVGDCSFSGAAAIAAADLGLHGTVYLEVFGADPAQVRARFDELRERAVAAAGSVRIGVSPHAPYSVGIEGYRTCLELDLPIATHLSESESELRYLESGGGPWDGITWLVEPVGSSGPRALAAEGLLSPRMIAAHCTVVDEEEIALLAEHDVAVAHCPRSNGSVGCGIAPLRALLDAGIRVGLGTDSPASAPSFDFFDELRAAVLFSRARERRPDALTAAEALELGTLGSARALGLDAEVGSLAAGKRADLAVVSFAGSPYHPWEDPAAAVVFGGSPDRVVTTFAEGEERYERGGFEWHELRLRAASARAKMLAESSEPASVAGAGS